MKEKIDFSYEISGDAWLKQKQPCIYVWFRYPFCLYVGQSDDGIQRLFSTHHHVINKVDAVRATDVFKLLWVPSEDLLKVEAKLINLLEPEYNKTHTTLNHTKEVKRLTQEGLVEAFSNLSTKVFGDETTKDLSKLSEDELTKFIADNRKLLSVVNRLEG
jgi:hypothetical protein